MDQLKKSSEEKGGAVKVDTNKFKLILSAEPNADFSISLLQNSVKLTLEPPKGIRDNMLKRYNALSDFQPCEKSREFRKAVYGLCWFHTILIERKKFKSLGWNKIYAFNDSDYLVCEDLLANYMGKLEDNKPIDPTFKAKDDINWAALKELIANCNYGGRVTDEADRRLLLVYAKDIFNDKLIAPEQWVPQGTEDGHYLYPADEAGFRGGADPGLMFTPQYFYGDIKDNMDTTDSPNAYGQHVNAEITSQILDTNAILASILVLTPQDVSSGEGGGEGGGGIAKKVKDYQDKIPELIDRVALKHKVRSDSQNPLNIVLQQECERYESILKTLIADLAELEEGLAGKKAITPYLENIVNCITNNAVPSSWGKGYFTMKPLSNWFDDLGQRYAFFDLWAAKSAPFVFWIGAFTFPTGFTTSLMQRFSRKANSAPIDQLTFEFTPMNRPPHEI